MSHSHGPIAVTLFANRLASIAEEMGSALERTAFSPNIKERRDYSCALFDERGRLIAQAAHIPVHLGAMPPLMDCLRDALRWRAGDMVLTNDPYASGTHLPDLTLVAPVFVAGEPAPVAFAANRAHHADVGGGSPGSMGLATELLAEGLVIPPIKLLASGRWNRGVLALLLRNVRTPDERLGDLSAQVAANRVGISAIRRLVAERGIGPVRAEIEAGIAYAERALRGQIAGFPPGEYEFADTLDGDGWTDEPIAIRVKVEIRGDRIRFDFSGSADQVRGPLNAPLAVTRSACYYVLRCLLADDVPANAGCLAPVEVEAPEGSVVHPRAPAAVAAGNVETSQRIVDVVLGALAQALPDRIPAASTGSMNNLTIGGTLEDGRSFAYYETMGGGAGGGPAGPGLSGVHTHMTNTRNTPIEALERHYPLRVRAYRLRRGSGGSGRHGGGDGIAREIKLLAACRVSVLTERRQAAPYGLQSGGSGQTGSNWMEDDTGRRVPLPGKAILEAPSGTVIGLESAGGGGWASIEVRSAELAAR